MCFMLRLFRHKMISTKSFLEKWFFRKYFSMFGSHKKITKCKNHSWANVAGIRQRPVAVAGFWRGSLTGSGWINSRIRPDPAGLAGIWQYSSWNLVLRWPDSGTGIIPAIGCCRTPAPTRFRRPTIDKFWRSDIKHACKDEEFNFGKRFTVLKIVNRFPKIKEAFTIKPKMIFVDHYFRFYQTPKNTEIVFKKSFYAETNGALNRKQ